MSLSPLTRHAFPRPQRGAASVAIAFLILLVIGAALATALSMSGSAVRDAAMSEEQVEALFLAESGLERAAYNYGVSGACTTAGVGTGTTVFSLASGGFTLDSAAPDAVNPALCRIRVTGRVRQVARAVDGWLSGGSGGGIAFDNSASWSRNNDTSQSWNYAVAGTNRLLVVGVSLKKNSLTQTVSSVTYNGVAMTRIVAQDNAVTTPLVRVELWYLAAPATGTNPLIVTLSTPNTGYVVGAVSLTGVDQSSPIEASTSARGLIGAPSVNIATIANNAWVLDALVVNSSPTSLSANAGQTLSWNTSTGGANLVRGAGSRRGPVSPAGSVTMSWTMSPLSLPWVIGAVSVKPAVGVSVVRWQEVVQ